PATTRFELSTAKITVFRSGAQLISASAKKPPPPSPRSALPPVAADAHSRRRKKKKTQRKPGHGLQPSAGADRLSRRARRLHRGRDQAAAGPG
ncbi:hypothetical protein A5N45_12995, partial [Streptococcus pneumoniae]